MNIRLDPRLASVLARVIVQRSLAAEMIANVINRPEYVHGDFLFWRSEHIEATRQLAEFGIKLHTYSGDARVPGLQ